MTNANLRCSHFKDAQGFKPWVAPFHSALMPTMVVKSSSTGLSLDEMNQLVGDEDLTECHVKKDGKQLHNGCATIFERISCSKFVDRKLSTADCLNLCLGHNNLTDMSKHGYTCEMALQNYVALQSGSFAVDGGRTQLDLRELDGIPVYVTQDEGDGSRTLYVFRCLSSRKVNGFADANGILTSESLAQFKKAKRLVVQVWGP